MNDRNDVFREELRNNHKAGPRLRRSYLCPPIPYLCLSAANALSHGLCASLFAYFSGFSGLSSGGTQSVSGSTRVAAFGAVLRSSEIPAKWPSVRRHVGQKLPHKKKAAQAANCAFKKDPSLSFQPQGLTEYAVSTVDGNRLC